MALRALAVAPRDSPWRMPVVPEDFDRDPRLTEAERAAMATHIRIGRGPGRLNPGSAPAIAARAALERLDRPLRAVAGLRGRGQGTQRLYSAKYVLYREMLRRGRSFWGWSREEWLETFRESAVAYRHHHGATGGDGRPMLMDLAYLLCGMTDLRAADMDRDRGEMARAIFGAEAIEASVARLAGGLVGREGLGFKGGKDMTHWWRSVLSIAFLLNRSPRLEDLTLDHLLDVEGGLRTADARRIIRHIGLGLDSLGLLVWPRDGSSPPVSADFAATTGATAGVPEEWAAWCLAWYARDTRLTPKARQAVLFGLFCVGRWLAAHHPEAASPECWDEDLALEYVSWLTNIARIGDDVSPDGHRKLTAKGTIGKPHSPQSVDRRLGQLRRAFGDWQDRSHAVGERPSCRISVRFKPQSAFATPAHVKRLIQPNPRDIDMTTWYKLTYAAANLSEEDLAKRGINIYPPTLYRALALLWVTSARRPNELLRLRIGCVRREWDPAMLDEDGLPLEREEGLLCSLHVPPKKPEVRSGSGSPPTPSMRSRPGSGNGASIRVVWSITRMGPSWTSCSAAAGKD